MRPLRSGILRARIALILAAVLCAGLFSGCGKKEQTTQRNDFAKGTVEKTVGGVTFSLPESWKIEEESGGRLVAAAKDDAGTEAVFTFEYLSAGKGGVNAIIADELLEAAAERYGFSPAVYLPTVVGEIDSAKTGVYTRKETGADGSETEVSERGLLIPIAGEGCFLMRKTVASDVYDAFEADFDAIWDSIVLPENAADDGSVSVDGTTIAESVTELSDTIRLRLAVIEYEGGRTSLLQDFSFVDTAAMSALFEEAHKNSMAVQSDALASSTLVIHFISRLYTSVRDLQSGSEIIYATDEDGNVLFEAPAWLTEEAPLDPADPSDALAKYREAWESFLNETVSLL